WCAHYDECLDYAVQGEWASFTCRECRAFTPMECDRDELLADSVGCRALVMTIFHPGAVSGVRRSTLGKVAEMR
ncbi:MAG: hypothetical protein RBS57_18965, partial [Desulforhabdus sp.]|nr:hypothetical protein [Desulforhabdus sp.]